MTNEEYYELERDEYYNTPIGSCDNCGVNVYPDEDDGSGLCGQCQWFAKIGNPAQRECE